jgi:two-component system cell cycle sensor histidine kinase/response regulator CckA
MNKTILLVEDDESLRRLADRLLRKLGCRVLAAANGSAAIAHCQSHSGDIDLLITDVFMPEIDGPELVKRLLAIRPALKVLFVSGSDEELYDTGVIEPTANFLHKPYTHDQLRKKIGEILDQ